MPRRPCRADRANRLQTAECRVNAPEWHRPKGGGGRPGLPIRGAVDSPAERTRTRQKNRIQTNDAPLESCMMAPCALHPADTAAPGSGMNARPTANVAASTRLNAASVRTMAYCSERGPMAKRGSSSMKPDASSDRPPVMVAPAWIQAESLSESIGPRVDRAHCRLSRTAQGQLTGGPLLQMKSPLANERAACERTSRLRTNEPLANERAACERRRLAHAKPRANFSILARGSQGSVACKCVSSNSYIGQLQSI